MKIYKRGDNGEILMHSDIYLGEDYTSPNLMHYKYLRKEYRNGHTYYIYDDSELKRAETVAKVANNVTKKGYWDGNTHTSSYYTKDGYRVTLSSNIGGSSRKNTKQDEQDKKNYKMAYAYVEKHRKQKLKDIPKRIFSRAVSFMSKVLRFFRGD